MKKIFLTILTVILIIGVGYGESIKEKKEEINTNQQLYIGEQIYKNSIVFTIFPPSMYNEDSKNFEQLPEFQDIEKSIIYTYLGVKNNNIKIGQEYYDKTKTPNTQKDILFLQLDNNKQALLELPVLTDAGLIYIDQPRILVIKIIDSQNNIKVDFLEKK